MKVYRIYDSKAEAYDDPVPFRTDGEAIRSVQVAVNTEGSRFHAHAADFTLFCVGNYTPDHPEIYPDTPKALINLLELSNAENILDGHPEDEQKIKRMVKEN